MAGRLIPTVSSAETWRRVYQSFQNINFTAFDFNAIKQSSLDYIKTYFPEIFNDFIESDEFIAWMELFAYVGELMAYRADLDSHENLWPVVQRMDNILRLAKFISYKTVRNIPARGLVKMVTIRTTETVVDGKGNVLTNKTITWNDPTNPDWKDQFIIVLNRALNGEFGTVSPSERVQVQDVLFELYSFNNTPLPNGVIPYSVTVSNASFTFELVPTLLTNNGPIERRPETDSELTVLYASDGLGDGSSTTGFLLYTKQGTLQEISQTFDGITPNQTFDIGATNINETDVWLNQVDNNDQITDDGTVVGSRSGEWIPVDIANAQNVIFNTNKIRNKYEIESLANDDVRLIFGDGEFANIPSGPFDIWYRVSANQDVIVPQNAISNTQGSFAYIDSDGNNQTLTFQFSLTSSIQNAAPTEDIEHIRRVGPGIFVTQNRMVNGEDYNTFLLQDTTILKLRSINRTFAGESNYLAINFNDPSEAYDNVKIFGNDLAVWFDQQPNNLPPVGATVTGTSIVENYLQPILSDPNFYTIRVQRGDSNPGRKQFTTAELNELPYRLGDTTSTHPIPLPSVGFPVYLVHDVLTDTWLAFNQNDYTAVWLPANPTNPYYMKVSNTNPTITPWLIQNVASTILADSEVTKFWFANAEPVVSYDTLDPSNDVMEILLANTNRNRDGVLTSNFDLIILGQDTYLNTGLPNIHRLIVTAADTSHSGNPGDVNLTPILNPSITKNTDATPASYTINVAGRASPSAPTGLPAPTAGFAILNVGGAITTDTTTNIPNDTTPYNFLVEIDQAPALNTTAVTAGIQALRKFYVSPNITALVSTYRKFTITGSTGNDGTYTIQAVQYVQGTSGFQVVNVGGGQIASNPTGLTNDIAATSGHQIITFSVAHSGGDATGLVNSTTVYTANVLIDGTTTIPLSVVGNTAQNFASLLSVIQTQLGNLAFIEQTGGNIQITSASTGATSTIAVTNTGANQLFAAPLVNVNAPGAWTTVPGTNSVQTIYTGTITIDGGIPQDLMIAGGSAQTYQDLITSVNATLTGAVSAINNGNVQITSNSVGTTSTVVITDTPLAIVSASSVTDSFVVAGDYTKVFRTGIEFTVTGTGADDGTYSTLSSSFALGNTTIFVSVVPVTIGAVGTLSPFSIFKNLDAFVVVGASFPGTNTLGTELQVFEAIPSGTFDGNINYHLAANTISFTTDGTSLQTYGALIDIINANLGTLGVAKIANGNISIISNTLGFLSKINVTNYSASNGIIQALAITFNEAVSLVYSGDTEGVDPQISMNITVGAVTTPIVFRMSQAQTYQDFSDTILSQEPGTPPLSITFPGGNMKLQALVQNYSIVAVITGIGGTWTISGNHASEFPAGAIVTVAGNSFAPANIAYTVVSATNVGPNTNIVVTTIPVGATATGSLHAPFVVSVSFVGTWDVTYLGHVPVNDVIITGSGTAVSTLSPLIVPMPFQYIAGRGDITVTGDLALPVTFNNIAPYNVNNTIQNAVAITSFGGNNTVTIVETDYVYLFQADAETETVPIEPTTDNIQAFIDDTASTNTNFGSTYSRRPGRGPLNFFWMHKTRDRHLIDPAATNIIDGFIIQRDYYINVKNWLNGLLASRPAAPTPFTLRQDYGYLLNNRMLSDTMVLRSGTLKVLFGPHSNPELQATFAVVKSQNATMTDNQIKSAIIATVQEFFDITRFEFGETFFFTELAAAIHADIPSQIDTVVLVPSFTTDTFGDLFQINAADDEVFIPDVTVANIAIVTSLSKTVIKQS